jgi:ABC-type Mn2+/Zn2+ transport system ATPase subunit
MDIEMTTLRNISNKDTKDTTPLLESEHLAVEYANSGYLSLCDLSFSFEGSDRVALMGMNGGGKSTLFKTLALSECVPISGFVSVAGHNIFQFCISTALIFESF